jgi:hypothetical protein
MANYRTEEYKLKKRSIQTSIYNSQVVIVFELVNNSTDIISKIKEQLVEIGFNNIILSNKKKQDYLTIHNEYNNLFTGNTYVAYANNIEKPINEFIKSIIGFSDNFSPFLLIIGVKYLNYWISQENYKELSSYRPTHIENALHLNSIVYKPIINIINLVDSTKISLYNLIKIKDA